MTHRESGMKNYDIINLGRINTYYNISDFIIIYSSANVSGNVTVGTCVELGTGKVCRLFKEKELERKAF